MSNPKPDKSKPVKSKPDTSKPVKTKPVKTKPEKPKLVTRRTLKDEGWTDALIVKFLGEPDKLVTNPNLRSGPRMRLYDMERVKAIQETPAFQTAREASRVRSEATKDGIQKKAQSEVERTLSEIRELDLSLPALSQSGLIQEFMDKRNRQQSPGFRDVIDYLRYDRLKLLSRLEDLTGKPGELEARSLLVFRVNESIENAYPWLRFDCFGVEESATE